MLSQGHPGLPKLIPPAEIADRQTTHICQAYRDMQSALELDPDHEVAYRELGDVYRRNGQYRRAADALQRAIVASPRSDRAYVELALILAALPEDADELLADPAAQNDRSEQRRALSKDAALLAETACSLRLSMTCAAALARAYAALDRWDDAIDAQQLSLFRGPKWKRRSYEAALASYRARRVEPAASAVRDVDLDACPEVPVAGLKRPPAQLELAGGRDEQGDEKGLPVAGSLSTQRPFILRKRPDRRTYVPSIQQQITF